jgi:hypothetical protein
LRRMIVCKVFVKYLEEAGFSTMAAMAPPVENDVSLVEVAGTALVVSKFPCRNISPLAY